MKFTNSLLEGKILKRYKRFLADIELDKTDSQHSEKLITAYVCNTGRMTTCWEPQQKVLLSYHNDPKRKLKYQLELVHNGLTWIGINTSLSNKIVQEAIQEGKIKELQGYNSIRPEIQYEKSRLDLLLHNAPIEQIKENKNKEDYCFVEIKNVTLKESANLASFPDTVTIRGQKHLQDLINLKKEGHRAVIFYLVQREDVEHFSPATHIDPKYTDLLKKAQKTGVEILIYRCKLNEKQIQVSKRLPLILT